MAPATRSKKTRLVERFVQIPRESYEEFIAWQRQVKSQKTFVPTKKEFLELQKAKQTLKQKKYLSLEEFEHDLDSHR